jgi:excisionase family DNA binding protein
MPQKYYNVQEAAKILGLTEDDIKQMLDSHELRGYRDGATWKFKVEDIEKLAGSGLNLLGEDGEDLLVAGEQVEAKSASKSGAVIGAADDDEAIDLVPNKPKNREPVLDTEPKEDNVDVSHFEELDLTLEEDLTLEDGGAVTEGQSTVDLGGSDLDDDDLVLGGSSGSGSDISIGGDSGISLVDPIDSGLSLEEPLSLSSDSMEALELGEDTDLVSLEEDAPTELKTDDDFLLTPLQETAEEDSESGSQVIALDTDSEGDDAATMVAGEGAGMAAMLDEDLSAEPEMSPMGLGDLGTAPGFAAEGLPLGQPEAVLPEMPYSIGTVVGLAACVMFLAVCGMFMFDLMRNMWSWDAAYDVNSSMMNWVLGLFESQ